MMQHPMMMAQQQQAGQPIPGVPQQYPMPQSTQPPQPQTQGGNPPMPLNLPQNPVEPSPIKVEPHPIQEQHQQPKDPHMMHHANSTEKRENGFNNVNDDHDLKR